MEQLQERHACGIGQRDWMFRDARQTDQSWQIRLET